jgi:hypothetical protein
MRFYKLICVVFVGMITTLASAQPDTPPKAPDEVPLKTPTGTPSEPPLLLPAGMELDPEIDPFAVIPARCKGKVKWLIDVQGYDKPVKSFTYPSAPILVVAVPRTGHVTITAITAVGDEPISAQVRIRAKGSEQQPDGSIGKSPAKPAKRLDVNIVYDNDKMTPELRAIIDGTAAKVLAGEGHAFHHYDYRSNDAVNRKLTEIVTRPGNGVPSLIILEQGVKESRLLPDGRPQTVPTTTEQLIEKIRKIAVQ